MQAKLGRKARRKPKRRRQHSSNEGVLAPAKSLLLTKRRRRWDLAACLGLGVKSGPHDGCDRGRQRLGNDLGVRSKTPSPGAPARRSYDRSSTRPVQGPRLGWCQSFGSERSFGVSLLSRSWSIAVKRGSTRGAARGLWPRVARHHERAARLSRVRSGIGQSRGCSFVSRLQKLVRRIFLVGAAREATRGRQ